MDKIKQYIESGIANAFVVHGNVRDFVDPEKVAISILADTLSRNGYVVVKYSVDQGTEFWKQAERQVVMAYLPKQDQGNPFGFSVPSSYQDLVALSKVQEFSAKQQSPMKMAIIIEFAEKLIPQNSIERMPENDKKLLTLLQRWGLSSGMGKLFLVTEDKDDIHSALLQASCGYGVVEVGVPTEASRRNAINAYTTAAGKDGEVKFEDGFDANQLTILSAGLTNRNVVSIIRKSLVNERIIRRSFVTSLKKDIIKSEFGGVLEIVEPRHSMADVGGNAEIKSYLREEVIDAIRTGSVNDMPVGLCFAGPSGVGKTYLALAMAYETGLPFFTLSISKMLDKFVGESERNLRRALAAIKSYGGIYFVDEVDQVLRRSNGSESNSINSNVFQMILTFMTEVDMDYRGKIVGLFATNWVGRLDPALIRPGRIDRVVPFFVPNENGIKEIIATKSVSTIGESPRNIDELATKMFGWTGSEVEQAARFAKGSMKKYGLTIEDAWGNAVLNIRPNTSAIAEMERDAMKLCNDSRLIPIEKVPMFMSLNGSNSDTPNWG